MTGRFTTAAKTRQRFRGEKTCLAMRLVVLTGAVLMVEKSALSKDRSADCLLVHFVAWPEAVFELTRITS